jgi:hypothetical protein
MTNKRDIHKRPEAFKLLNGDIRVWIEQEAIHIIAVDLPYLDPVELTCDLARQLVVALQAMVEQLE